MAETCVEEDVELAVYFVLSDIIHQNGCCLWISPYGGIADVEESYKDRGVYEVVRIHDMTDDAIRALTERQRDTSSGEAEQFHSSVCDATQDAYRAGLAGESIPIFKLKWPEGGDVLRDAIITCRGAAYAVGVERKERKLFKKPL